MVFASIIVNLAPSHHSDMSLKKPSERELISRRIAAAKRVKRKRWLLRMGLSKSRTLWKRLKHKQ